MKKRGFTLIELLAVIVVLAIVALIATPIVMNIIKDAKEESNKRSVEMYAKALELSIAQYQLVNNSIPAGKYTTTDGKNLIKEGETEPTLIVDYNGDVVFDNIIVFDDAEYYLSVGSINGDDVDIEYGRILNFSTDSWQTIAKYKDYGFYKVGDTKEIELDLDNDDVKTSYTIRVMNTSTPEECGEEGFSQSACGFVLEFVDVLSVDKMRFDGVSTSDWSTCKIRNEALPNIYNALPDELKNIIIDTYVVTGKYTGETAGTVSEDVTITTDKLYLLSSKEVWNELIHDSNDKTRQLDYYEERKVSHNNAAAAAKDEYYWLRTPCNNLNECFVNVYDAQTGGWAGKFVGRGSDTDNKGISPAFRIGIN